MCKENKKSEPHHIAVGVSGGGRSLENLIIKQEISNFKVALVIASSSHCKAIDIANKHNIELIILNFNQNDPAQLKFLDQKLEQHQIQLITLAGFLKKFPIQKKWENKIINIHPSLLPRYGGKGMYGSKVHQAVYNAKERKSGATVHYVNGVYDDGEIISQIEIEIEEQDNPEDIANKVFASECKLLPKTVEQILSNELPLLNKKIKVFK